MTAHWPHLANALAFAGIVACLALGYRFWREATRAPLIDGIPDEVAAMDCYEAGAVLLLGELMPELEEVLALEAGWSP